MFDPLSSLSHLVHGGKGGQGRIGDCRPSLQSGRKDGGGGWFRGEETKQRKVEERGDHNNDINCNSNQIVIN